MGKTHGDTDLLGPESEEAHAPSPQPVSVLGRSLLEGGLGPIMRQGAARLLGHPHCLTKPELSVYKVDSHVTVWIPQETPKREKQ